MDNDVTLATYNAHVDEYVTRTPHSVNGDHAAWLSAAVDRLPTSAAILEVGAGFGRDAAYLSTLGYSVTLTDAAEGFVDRLRADGYDATLLNVLSDPIPGTWDLILANAVLLHFTRDQLAHVLVKIRAALTPAGRFAFSLKVGDGEGWSQEKLEAPRWFTYWRPHAITAAVTVAGFANVRDIRDWTDPTWMRLIAGA